MTTAALPKTLPSPVSPNPISPSRTQAGARPEHVTFADALRSMLGQDESEAAQSFSYFIVRIGRKFPNFSDLQDVLNFIAPQDPAAMPKPHLRRLAVQFLSIALLQMPLENWQNLSLNGFCIRMEKTAEALTAHDPELAKSLTAEVRKMRDDAKKLNAGPESRDAILAEMAGKRPGMLHAAMALNRMGNRARP